MMIKKTLPTLMAGMLAVLAGGAHSAGVVSTGSGSTTTPTDVNAIIAQTQAQCKTDPAACGISLSDLLGNVQFGETEPNNSMYAADVITPNYPITGQLLSATDQDWYHFETTQANAEVTVLFPTMPANWIFNIHDFSGNVLASSSTVSPTASTGGYAFKATMPNPGLYYISVVAPSLGQWIDDIYQFTLVLREFADGNTQPGYNFYDVEQEQNQRNDLFSTANVLTTNHEMRGQLQTSRDVDLFRIDSAGNEILTVDFCQPGSICNQLREAWVALIFDGSKVSDETLSLKAIVSVWDESYGEREETTYTTEKQNDPNDPDCDNYNGTGTGKADEKCPQIDVQVPKTEKKIYGQAVFYESTHPHFVWYHTGYNQDQADIPGDDRNKLRGVMDPWYGAPTTINIVADRPSSFYVMIVSKVDLQDDLSMVKWEKVEKRPDYGGIMIKDYNTNNYSLRLTRTTLDPNMNANPLDPNLGRPSSAVGPLIQSLQAKLDSTTHILRIPELLHEGRIYEATLMGKPAKKGGGYAEFQLTSMKAVASPLTLVSGVPQGSGGAERQALQAELNTTTHELHIPELKYDGRIVELILVGTPNKKTPGYKKFKPKAMNPVFVPITNL